MISRLTIFQNLCKKCINNKRYYSNGNNFLKNNTTNIVNRQEDPPKLSLEKDTIYSLASGVGKSGVAVIRVSGSQSKEVLKGLVNKKESEFKPRYATIGTFFHPLTKEAIDKGMFIYFKSPHSFTGEDVVEFHIHGGRAVIHDTLDAISSIGGTRTSQPGEFTKRAFDNGKMDLSEVEGLADLIDSQTHHQRKIAFNQMQGSISRFYYQLREDLIRSSAYMEAYIDFGEDAELDPEIVEQSKNRIIGIRDRIQSHLNDGKRGERLRQGAQVTILGPPNAGKSSLINLLTNRKVSIVSPIPGTTRDIIEAMLDIGGYPVIIGDTAGIRQSSDTIELEGVQMAKERSETSDLSLCVLDASQLIEQQTSNSQLDNELLNIINSNTIFIFNKMDIINESPLKKEIWGRKKLEILDNIVKHVNETRKHIDKVYGKDSIQSVEISCIDNMNIRQLLDYLQKSLENLFECQEQDSPLLTRMRYKEALINCVESLDRYLYFHDSDIVIASEELRSAIKSIGEITHSSNIDDLLDIIFKDFCIGK
ncbi:GTP-binding protein 3 [Tieghemostelium lacteum]|uniref:GTP-binding protein 3 n=1 Tax=Tieghemostelium lacteum TaxID=361077 RepID=A0A152A418_TIELA|nr:GTP-binding protein 3 [Tieghemostelium lacteum]|eukprot:KYR00835.1 GTP-binding protein 3 [Tieghemostelium lacteum]